MPGQGRRMSVAINFWKPWPSLTKLHRIIFVQCPEEVNLTLIAENIVRNGCYSCRDLDFHVGSMHCCTKCPWSNEQHEGNRTFRCPRPVCFSEFPFLVLRKLQFTRPLIKSVISHSLYMYIHLYPLGLNDRG